MATQKVTADPGALERQHRGQRRRSLRRKAEVYALVGALVVVGAALGIGALRYLSDGQPRPGRAPNVSPEGTDQSPTPVEELPPTVDRLAGIWLIRPDGDLLLRLGRDGSFAFIPDGYVGGFGTYEVMGQTITFTYTGGRFCSGMFTWEAGLPEDGRLRAVNIRSTSPCEPERQVGRETNWTRVSPWSDAAGQITAERSPPLAHEPRIPSESLIQGVWLLEERGVLLRLGGGSYALDGGGELVTVPDDQGTFEVDSATGVFSFTSGPNSRTCAEGDSWAWANAELSTNTEFSVMRLRAIVTEDACGKNLGPDLVWFRLQDLLAG
ncbi:MAG: hypothetical protein ACRDIX_07135 [Actinomycetota bacterium]